MGVMKKKSKVQVEPTSAASANIGATAFSFFSAGDASANAGFVPYNPRNSAARSEDSRAGRPCDISRDNLDLPLTFLPWCLRNGLWLSIQISPPFYTSRVAILGDATHATTPHQCWRRQAIEDAHFLAEILADPSVMSLEHEAGVLCIR